MTRGRYWDLFRNHPNIQGGFIWDWCDALPILPVATSSSPHTACGHILFPHTARGHILLPPYCPWPNRNPLPRKWPLPTLPSLVTRGRCDQALLQTLPDHTTRWAYGGDYGPFSYPHDKQFCINGLIFADRTPHPALEEVRHLQQPLYARFATDLSLEVKSTLDFITTDHLEVRWELRRRGEAVAAGGLPMPMISPHGVWHASKFELPWTADLGEIFHTPIGGPITLWLITFCREETAWCVAGAEVGTQTFDIVPPVGSECALATLSPPWREPSVSNARVSLQCVVNDGWTVSGEGFSVHVDETGVLRSHNVDGVELVSRGPLPCLWRAPTDNDEFGRFADGWRQFGLHNVHRVVESLRAWQPTEGLASIQVDWRLLGSHGQRLGTCMFAYIITADGQVELCVHMFIELSSKGGTEPPPTIPRLGISLQVPRKPAQSATWYGLGPHENYPDRRSSAHLGQWRLPVEAMHTPYVVPSENGGRGGVRWVAVTQGEDEDADVAMRDGRADGWRAARHAFASTLRAPLSGDALYEDPHSTERADEGRVPIVDGLLLAAGPLTPPLQASVSPYSDEAISAAKHDAELVAGAGPSDPLTIHLDVLHMGVGGHDSWTPMRTIGERYFVQPTQRSLFRIRMTPLSGGHDPAAVAADVAKPIVHSGTTIMLRALPDSNGAPTATKLDFATPDAPKSDFRFDFGQFVSAPTAAEDKAAPMAAEGDAAPPPNSPEDAPNGGISSGDSAPAPAVEGDRGGISVYQASSAGYIDWAKKAAGEHEEGGAARGGDVGSMAAIGEFELDGDDNDDDESEYDSSLPDSPVLYSPPIAPGSGGGARLLAMQQAGTAEEAPEVDAYLRVANAVGVATLPAALPSASRYFAGLVVEKPGGGPVLTHTSVSLRGCNGYCIEVEADAVGARWTIPGEWQSFVLEPVEPNLTAAGRKQPPLIAGRVQSLGGTPVNPSPGGVGRERLLRHGDVVCLRAHTGKLLRCPKRSAVGRDESVTYAPLEATAWSHEEAARFEILLC